MSFPKKRRLRGNLIHEVPYLWKNKELAKNEWENQKIYTISISQIELLLADDL